MPQSHISPCPPFISAYLLLYIMFSFISVISIELSVSVFLNPGTLFFFLPSTSKSLPSVSYQSVLWFWVFFFFKQLMCLLFTNRGHRKCDLHICTKGWVTPKKCTLVRHQPIVVGHCTLQVHPGPLCCQGAPRESPNLGYLP